MTFLDSSVIIDMLAGVTETVDAVEDRGGPYLTSTICVFEVLNGKVGAGETDIEAARADFAGVRAIELTEDVALEAARMQDRLLDEGERMAARDLLIAATARSSGDELLVAGVDFEASALAELMTVRNLSR